ncbi:MAG: S1 family peptidase, partial [Myxococcales bacterium]|nr:S1 family peptidase [Myxococcales bacterium]
STTPGCTASPRPLDGDVATHAAIVNGTASSDPSVVFMFAVKEGGMCTGTLIAPRVVLTAKHCVQRPGADAPDAPQFYTVGTGSRAFRPDRTYRVVDVRTTPGVWSQGGQFGLQGALVGQDIGILTLAEPIEGVTPQKIRRTFPEDQAKATLRVVGYGQTPNGQTGVKYETTTTANGIQGNNIYTGTSTCQGDSGGPLFEMDTGEIIAVTSFGNGVCGFGFAAYNLVYPFLDLIDQAVMDSGSCLNSGEETCDGIDNDCDDEIDEDCLAIGQACTSDDECVGAYCATVGARKLCSTPCDPTQPFAGCDAGSYCAHAGGCEGACVPRGTGTADAPIDAQCNDDTDCASLYCGDPGDGVRRCLTPCRADGGGCFADEACGAAEGSCGGCADADLVPTPHGLGEPCAAANDCRSEECLVPGDGAGGYCTKSCDGDGDCAGSFHCRGGQCVRGVRGGVGSVCVSPNDCQSTAVCAVTDDTSWCTVECVDDNGCPDNFACLQAGSLKVCQPMTGILGDACAGDDGCATDVCVSSDAGKVCSRACDPNTPCDTGFECVRYNESAMAGYCLPEGARLSSDDGDDRGGSGCAVSPSRPTSAPIPWIVAGVIGLALRRRR